MSTTDKLHQVLETRFGGELARGFHVDRDRCCVLELVSHVKGEPWTDHPRGYDATGTAIRPLNDGPWSSDRARTEHCLPLALLDDAGAADGWAERYLVSVYREIIPIALRAEGFCDLAHECENVQTVDDVRSVNAVALRSVRSREVDDSTLYAVLQISWALGAVRSREVDDSTLYAVLQISWALDDDDRRPGLISGACISVSQGLDGGDVVLGLAVDLLIRAYGR